jgi:TRAP-type C4-dicarboxylate transport system substrate-binding protein
MQAASNTLPRAHCRLLNRALVPVIAAGVGLAMVAGSVMAAEVNLKAGYFISNKKSLTRQAFDQFIAKVNADGKGLVQIPQVVGKEAIPSRQLGNAVKSGLLDLAGTPPAYMANLVKLATGFTPTTKTAKVMRANGAWDIFKGLFAKQANMHLLSMYGGDIVFHIYSNKPITKLSDFKGMKLRTSNTYKAFFDALGARTLNMPRREIFTAMERGAVDAYANLDSEVMSQGWYEVSKFKLVPGFYHPIIVVGVNLKKWNTLNAAQQGVMTKAGLYLENELSADLGRKDREIGNKLVSEKGMRLLKLSKADSEKFLDLAYTAQWDLVEKRDPVVGKKLRALIGR